jgi:hypothetical protein
MSEDWQGRWARALVRAMSVFLVRPVFECDVKGLNLREMIDNTKPAEVEELKFVESMACPNKTIQNIKQAFKLLGISFVARVLVYCYFMLFKYNVLAKESRLVIGRDPSTGRPSYSFACLTSNCSSLFDPVVNATRSRLIMDELPIFSICQPFLSQLNEPIQHVTSLIGLYVCTIMACYYVVSDRLLCMEQSKIRTKNSLLLFLVAPNISHRIRHRAAQEHVQDLHWSFLQYRHLIWANRFNFGRREAAYLSNFVEVADVQRQRPLGPLKSERDARRRRSTMTHQSSVDYFDRSPGEFVQNCTPCTRFESWRRRTIYLMIGISVNLALTIISLPFMQNLYTMLRLQSKRDLLNGFHLDMNKAGCSIWRKQHLLPVVQQQFGNESHSDDTIDLQSLRYEMNTYGALSTLIVMYAWPTCAISVPVYLVLVNSLDLRCLVCELKYKIIMLLPVIKNMTDAMLRERAWFESRHRKSYLDEHNCLENTLRGFGGGQHVTNRFNLGKLRDKFVNDVRVLFFSLLSRPFLDHKLRLETQTFITNECLDERFKSSAGLSHWPVTLAELMEKLYVQFRILDDLLTEAQPSISVVTGTTAGFCYVALAVTLAFYRIQRSIIILQCMIVGVSLVTTVGLILNSAILEAKVSRDCPDDTDARQINKGVLVEFHSG